MRSHQNVRTLSLVVFTFTFLLIGAAVFDALESERDEDSQIMLEEMEQEMKKKYSITDEDYRVLETTIIKMEPHKAGPQWKFIGAFYFATVVLVMIGYGHSTPATVGGKAFVILYAIIGIPMGLVMFQHIGERLNKGASIIIKKLKILFRRKNPEVRTSSIKMSVFHFQMS
ncbi:Two pore potassium channel protein sup-9 [Amphibalanus amphitrite]|uniref:Two pore potassium channel protein sup-9 n=1 Tax=Amphibalanus amphitrite TaxID=1232801 RepID=A0A6A4WKX8_AMPAM|nr:Two pore potassium channel protein sup-9 [Amphibalanus amphitrite]KAF0308066.1 Two pore potassium channel protein sup-9 [Amphibalanus amphitrite]